MGALPRHRAAAVIAALLCCGGIVAVSAGCQSNHVESFGAPVGASRAAGAMVAAPMPGHPAADRAIIKTGWLKVTVEDVPAATAKVEALVKDQKGYLESSQTNEEKTATINFRIPADQLDAILDQVSALGEEESRSVTATDVTEEVADLEAALANTRALRDRLRTLLQRATKVEDILKIETELGRLQTDVDQMEGRLQRLRTQVALSSVTVELIRKPVLGPLGYVGKGLAWFFEKAVVIRD